MRFKVLMFFVLASFIFIFAGCAKQTSTTIAASSVTVVTTYAPATDIVLALNGKDNLVGADNGSAASALLAKLNPKHQVVGVGKKGAVNVETIIGLHPDVVVLYPVEDSDTTKIQLEAAGIKVIVIDPETTASLQSDIMMVGQAIGKADVAQKLIDYMNNTISQVASRIKQISTLKKVFLAYEANGVLNTSAGTFYQHELITEAGGNDVAKDLTGGWVNVDTEQLLTWNPDVMFVVHYSTEHASGFMADNSLSSLAAVENKQVFDIPSNLESWDMPIPSSALAIWWMAKNLYPQEFSDVNILTKANDFYQEFYGQSFEALGGVL